MLGVNKTDSTHPSEEPNRQYQYDESNKRESKAEAMMALDSNSENLAGSLGKSSRFDDDQNDSSEELGAVGSKRMYEVSQVNNSTFANVT